MSTSLSPMDVLQIGGAGGAVSVALLVLYKLASMIVNHRCRSDCCGRLFSLGIEVEATIPQPYRTELSGEATLNHRLLTECHLSGLSDGIPSASRPIPIPPSRYQSTMEVIHRNSPTGVEEDMSSLSQSSQPSTVTIEP